VPRLGRRLESPPKMSAPPQMDGSLGCGYFDVLSETAPEGTMAQIPVRFTIVLEDPCWPTIQDRVFDNATIQRVSQARSILRRYKDSHW
jgi:hypothetical protein